MQQETDSRKNVNHLTNPEEMKKTKNRAKVTGVTINLSYPDGSSRTITIDPARVEAIFWSDRGVKEILAPFYDTIDKMVSKQIIIERFGEGAAGLVAEYSDEFKITPELIKLLWDLEHGEDGQIAFICKTIKCIPTVDPKFL